MPDQTKEEPTVQVGDQVCYMLAFGQFYLAEVTGVYPDQVFDNQPTIDLVYNGVAMYHVPHQSDAQQPHSYQLADDAGWSHGLSKPAPRGVVESEAKTES